MKYIYQYKEWPEFYWDTDLVINALSNVRLAQGRILGRLQAVGFDIRNIANLDNLTVETIKSAEIEGEIYNPETVRSSVAKRLGLDTVGLVASERNIDGMVDMMVDASQKCFEPLTVERLFNWHYALFPTGRSGMYQIEVGQWRTDSTGPMQVVSGAMGKEKVHFQAPAAAQIPDEINHFLKWFNGNPKIDTLLKAAVAHLWFVTIHPFDDGNGRITRAMTEMLLARADSSPQRFYSMSAQIRIERNKYYTLLERTQKGDLDITEWMVWFLTCLEKAIIQSEIVLQSALKKNTFWNMHAGIMLNPRQHKMLNKLLDGFDGKLNTSKWAKINKCSNDTALRDIQDLITKNILVKEAAGGRSSSYVLVHY